MILITYYIQYLIILRLIQSHLMNIVNQMIIVLPLIQMGICIK